MKGTESPPKDTKWIDTDKAFEGEPMQDQITNLCKRVKE